MGRTLAVMPSRSNSPPAPMMTPVEFAFLLTGTMMGVDAGHAGLLRAGAEHQASPTSPGAMLQSIPVYHPVHLNVHEVSIRFGIIFLGTDVCTQNGACPDADGYRMMVERSNSATARAKGIHGQASVPPPEPLAP